MRKRSSVIERDIDSDDIVVEDLKEILISEMVIN